MDYLKACEILKVSDPDSIKANADYARGKLEHRVSGAPLRFSVAAQVLIDAEVELVNTEKLETQPTD